MLAGCLPLALEAVWLGARQHGRLACDPAGSPPFNTQSSTFIRSIRGCRATHRLEPPAVCRRAIVARLGRASGQSTRLGRTGRNRHWWLLPWPGECSQVSSLRGTCVAPNTNLFRLSLFSFPSSSTIPALRFSGLDSLGLGCSKCKAAYKYPG